MKLTIVLKVNVINKTSEYGIVADRCYRTMDKTSLFRKKEQSILWCQMKLMEKTEIKQMKP